MNYVEKIYCALMLCLALITWPAIGSETSSISTAQHRLNRSLMAAIKLNNSLAYIKRLVALGADMNAEDYQGLTPFKLACNLKRVNLIVFFSTV